MNSREGAQGSYRSAIDDANAQKPGLTNTQIASQPHITGKTVGIHIANILNKLQVADRAQAIVRAREAGLSRAS